MLTLVKMSFGLMPSNAYPGEAGNSLEFVSYFLSSIFEPIFDLKSLKLPFGEPMELILYGPFDRASPFLLLILTSGLLDADRPSED